ncbi:MAG: single-stranded-DNA-specific exonuclease RecJ [Patescibacteria group bacterium]
MNNWNILRTKQESDEILDLILSNRGLSEKQAREDFLSPPSVKELLKKFPFEFKKALKDAKRIVTEAIEKDIPIVIYGDYDADGVCATAIMYKTIKYELAYDRCFYFIPNRFEHGYGLSKKAIDLILKKAKSAYDTDNGILMITVDTGITGVEEVAYARELNFTVIVTDHHQQPEVLPPANCIVWEDQIVGSGIAWIFSRVLGSSDNTFLSLAAIATVTDLQPLLGFNRSLVKRGLELLNKEAPLGIKVLLEESGTNATEITTYHLGWVIGPRLNASGRLVDASESLDLLISRDADNIKSLASQLNEINNSRQEKTQEMYTLIGSYRTESVPNIIISDHDQFHEGIIGLVASKLVQKYYRPSIVISTSEEIGKGSARSIPGINIIETLRKFDNLFLNLGGHPMAAGFSIEKNNILELKESLLNYALIEFTAEQLIPELTVDVELPFESIEDHFLNDLEELKPYGIGNKEPLFLSRKLGVLDIRWVGKTGAHLSLKLFSKGITRKAVFFGAKEHKVAALLKEGDLIDAVFKIERNDFNGRSYLNIQIVDLRFN